MLGFRNEPRAEHAFSGQQQPSQNGPRNLSHGDHFTQRPPSSMHSARSFTDPRAIHKRKSYACLPPSFVARPHYFQPLNLTISRFGASTTSRSEETRAGKSAIWTTSHEEFGFDDKTKFRFDGRFKQISAQSWSSRRRGFSVHSLRLKLGKQLLKHCPTHVRTEADSTSTR